MKAPLNNTIKQQILATICCNIIGFSYGASCAWASVNFLYLQSDDSPLASGRLTVSQASLVVSLLCVGGFVGNVLMVFLAEKFGRKLPLLFLAVPSIMSCLLIYLATAPWYLYIARLLAGFAGGGCLVLIPIYVSEIASDSVRGSLGSILILSINAGILFGFIVGEFFSYFSQLKIFATIPVLFFILFNFFPESPEYLLLQEKKVLAEKSIGYYTGVLSSETKTEKNEKEIEAENGSSTDLTLGSFFKPAAKKALLIGIILSFFNQFCGCFAMVSYTTKIFADAGSTLSPGQSSIIIAVAQLTANFCATILVDKAGRKILFSLSAVGTGLGLLCLGSHSLFKDQLVGYNWIPIVSFAMVIFIASIGILPLQFVILVEVLPKAIKNAASSLCTSFIWIIGFILTQYYPLLAAHLGVHTCMFFFASVCFAGAIFVILVIPETKGKSYTEIMQALVK